MFGEEQGVAGFNNALTCCNQFWAGVQEVPVIRGAFITNDKLQLVKDLVSRARATPTTLSYTIRPNASWNWGGRKIPVTYEDFAYTWSQMVAPGNAVVGRDGYDRITGFTHRGLKQITFTWSQPYGAWQQLFSTVFPSAALIGTDFNRIWTNCICGSDGKPVSDGPFMLTNYTQGVGSTLKRNPFWYGRKPRLRQVDCKVIADTNAEVQAMRRGEVDAINPTFGVNLLPLRDARGITYNQVPGLFQEHIDLQFGAQGQPLLRAPWMRRALMLGIDRQSIITTLYGELAGATTPLDNLLFYPGDPSYRPDFRKWNFNPRKALSLLRRHCTEGPTQVSPGNTSIWACSGIRASFRYTWTASNAIRTTQAPAAIALEELWNELAETRSFALLCGYHLDVFQLDVQRDALPEVMRMHSHTRTVEEPSRLAAAVDQALAEVVGPFRAARIYLEVAEHVPHGSLSRGQAVLSWLSSGEVRLAHEILQRARMHYARLRNAPLPA